MTAVDFLNQKRRMCEKTSCSKCPLGLLKNGTQLTCSVFMERFPEEAISKLIQWTLTNPLITNKDKFMDVFGSEAYIFQQFNNNDWWQQEYKGGD